MYRMLRCLKKEIGLVLLTARNSQSNVINYTDIQMVITMLVAYLNVALEWGILDFFSVC